MFLRLTDDEALLDQIDHVRSVVVFGVEIGDQPVDVSGLPDEHKATLSTNPFFVRVDQFDHDGDGRKSGAKSRKGKPAPVTTTVQEDPRRAELVAQLEGLEVDFDPNADTDALEAALDAATAP